MARARDYPAVITRLAAATVGEARGSNRKSNRESRMQAVADAIWAVLHGDPVSWVGFYVDRPEEPDDRRLVLGPHRDKPACSPIGLHGVCGQALSQRRCRIVEDVATLGDAYVACDPRDRSEIVLPLVDAAGVPWGVLDLDSWSVGAFDRDDEAGLRRVLTAAQLVGD